MKKIASKRAYNVQQHNMVASNIETDASESSDLEEDEIRVYNTSKTQVKNTQKVHKCPLCHAPHGLEKCKQFLDLTPKKRRMLLRTFCICYICLKKGHIIPDCDLKVNCKICKRKHHDLLHISEVKDAKDPKKFDRNKATVKHTTAGEVTIETDTSTDDEQTVQEILADFHQEHDAQD